MSQRKDQARGEQKTGRAGRRPSIAVEVDGRTATLRIDLGTDLRQSRVRRHWTQGDLAVRVGLDRQTVGRVERGAPGTPLEAIARVAEGVGRPLSVSLRREAATEPIDAVHLAMQELVLRTARAAGFDGFFELPVRPAEPWRSIDIGLSSERLRAMIAVECWNSMGDIGAAARSSARKLAAVEDRAVARWGVDGIGGVVWLLRATAANRQLVARYPEVFTRRFPGSSRLWLNTLTRGELPPSMPGLVWCDARAVRLFAWRRGDAAALRA